MTTTANAQLQFSAPANYPVGIAPSNLAVGDCNGDGKQDFAVANSGTGNVSILLGNGDGTFQQAIDFTAGSPLTFVAVGDFNGDGKLDLAVANGSANRISILLGKGDGTFELPLQYNTVGALYGVNQLHQLCVSEGVFALLGNGNGTFSVSASEYLPRASCWYPPPPWNPYAPNLAIADLNNDGKPDLVVPVVVPKPSIVGGQKTAVWVFLGNGDGTFAGPRGFNLTATPDWLSVGEFKAGTLPSLVLSNSSTNNISVLPTKTS
jgi:hypothetical protein